MATSDSSKNTQPANWSLGSVGTPGQSATQSSILGSGAALIGKMVSTGNIEIHGHFQGDVETPATVTIGESGSIEGTIKAGNVTVRGSLIGTIQAKDVVRLAKSARIRADVAAGQLEMEAGAELVGTCAVTGALPSNSDTLKAAPSKVSNLK